MLGTFLGFASLAALGAMYATATAAQILAGRRRELERTHGRIVQALGERRRQLLERAASDQERRAAARARPTVGPVFGPVLSGRRVGASWVHAGSPISGTPRMIPLRPAPVLGTTAPPPQAIALHGRREVPTGKLFARRG